MGAPPSQRARTIDAEMDEATVLWLMVPEAPWLADFAEVWTRPAWMTQGACRGTDVDRFVPRGGGASEAALMTCGRCPVRQECLEHALADPSLVGVWGGTTEAERRRLRRMAG